MKQKEKKEMIAKKDHVILQNDFYLVIKAGDDLKGIPEKYIPTLKAEKIL